MADDTALLTVVVVASLGPNQARECTLRLPAGATVADAIEASDWQNALAPHSWAAYGIWGRIVATTERLRDQDRVELYRPLKVDPKVARRQRFARQGARAAGLFARRSRN